MSIISRGWTILTRTIPALRPIYETSFSQTPISTRALIWYWVAPPSAPYWQVHPTSAITGDARNVYCGIETCPGYMPGCYIQAIGKIHIGDYTQIGPGVGIISANHDPHDSRKHIPSEVRIGAYGWIGKDATILPGVTLGDFTIVGAGAIVTKSFPEGHCVLAGNPARIVKRLDPEKCVRHRSKYEYNGFIPHDRFEALRARP